MGILLAILIYAIVWLIFLAAALGGLIITESPLCLLILIIPLFLKVEITVK